MLFGHWDVGHACETDPPVPCTPARTLGFVNERNPEPQEVFLSPAAGASASTLTGLTTAAQIRASAAASSAASASVSVVPLVRVASAAVYPSATGPQVVITPRPESSVPQIDVSLSENAWDLTTLTAGIAAGGLAGHAPGAVLGGVVTYAWGRWRWLQTHRSEP
jgi:hypothetical protein